MEKIIEQLVEWKANIESDILSDWHEEKLKSSLQVLRLEQAISLLKNVGENNNIEV